MASSTPVGEGCFGKVYRKPFGDTWAAVKRVPVGIISNQQLIRECKVYLNARHPNVVKLLGMPWIEVSKWNIPLEFIFGEDLETTIFKTQISKIQSTPAVRATIITGMCEGLLYLHSKDIVHQDLKPDNIMVEHQTHRAVIIDLGLAKFSKNGLSSAANMGNEAYSAPEILLLNRVRDKRSDVWAMGKIIAELCLNARLLTAHMSATTIQEILKESLYSNPVSKMANVNPDLRATMAEVISYIREVSTYTVNPDQLAKLMKRCSKKLKEMQIAKPKQLPQKEPSQQVMQLIGPTVPSQSSLMSFPCLLPDTGKVTEDRYDAEKAALVHKEIITKGGQIIKYKKVEITKHS